MNELNRPIASARRADSTFRLSAPLVLASASPRRAEILRSLGCAFVIDPANVDEDVHPLALTARALAARVAMSKASAVARRHPESITLAADTVVALDGRLLGKPRDAAEARSFLSLLRGRAHSVITAVSVEYNGATFCDTRETVVQFREYSDDEVAAYVGTGSPLDKAGAYGIQDRPFAPAASYRGCYLNVVGLPACLTLELLERAGAITPPVPAAACPGHSGPDGKEARK